MTFICVSLCLFQLAAYVKVLDIQNCDRWPTNNGMMLLKVKISQQNNISFYFDLLFSGDGSRNNATNTIVIESLLSNILLHRLRLAIFNFRIPLRVVFSTAFFSISAFDLPPYRCNIFLTSLWDDSPPCSLSSPKPCLKTFS